MIMVKVNAEKQIKSDIASRPSQYFKCYHCSDLAIESTMEE